ADLYGRRWLAGTRAKLGPARGEEGDRQLADELQHLMHEPGADHTETLPALAPGRGEQTPVYDSAAGIRWREAWRGRVGREGKPWDEVRARMRRANPAVIPRNHRVEEALAAAVGGDLGPLEKLLGVLADPYAYSEAQEEYALPPEPSPIPYVTYCGT